MPGIDRAVAIAGYGQYPVVLKDDGTVWLLANYPDLENASLLPVIPTKSLYKSRGLIISWL